MRNNHLVMVLTIFSTFSLFVFCVGCGNDRIKTEPVEGVVLVDGKPYEMATVTFIPKDDADPEAVQSYGKTNSEGKYKLQAIRGNPDAGTTPGEYIVTVHRTDSLPGDGRGNVIQLKSSDDIPAEYIPVEQLPAKYKNPKTTPFTATVVKGKNKFDFELESK